MLGVLITSCPRGSLRTPMSSAKSFGGGAPMRVGSFVDAVLTIPDVVLMRGVCRLGWPIFDELALTGETFSEEIMKSKSPVVGGAVGSYDD